MKLLSFVTISYDKYRLALKRLAERYQDYEVSFDRKELLPSDREALQESCIQRFETCFDMLWKHLKKYLEAEIGLSDLPNGPKPLFRLAIENEILYDFDRWADYNNKRIGTSHDYSGTKATEAMEIIPQFLKDAVALYERFTGEPWK